MHRRKVLLSSGVALTTALAGCGESESSDREEGTTDDTTDNSDDGGDSADDTSDTGSTDDSGGEEDLVELLEHEWYNQGQYDAGVSGQLENLSGETLDYVEVSVYFIDEDGVQFEEGLDNTNDLAADRVWEFDAMFMGDDPQRVENYEIETQVNNY